MATVVIRNVPDDLDQRLKARALSEGRPVSELLLDMIERLLARPDRGETPARLDAANP